MGQMIKRWVPLLGWFAGGTIALVALWSIDQTRFDLPPPQPAQWSQWAATRDPFDAVAGVSRLIATVAIAYLLVVSAVHLVSLLWGPRGSRRFTARLNPGPIAAIVATAVLGSSPFAGAANATATTSGPDLGSNDPPAPVMRVLGDDDPAHTESTTTVVTTATTAPPNTVPPNTVPPNTVPPNTGPPTTTSTSTTNPSVIRQPAPTPAPSPGPGRSGELPSDRGKKPSGSFDYRVTRGDNLWLIAERRIRLGLGREGTEDEVRGYWLALMDLNAGRLVQPGNPNVLYSGQELILPG